MRHFTSSCRQLIKKPNLSNSSGNMKNIAILIVILLLLPSVVFAEALPDKIITYKTIDGISLKLHIFNPPNHNVSDSKSSIVFFFGGGWVVGSPTQFYKQSEYLASRGMVAISAEYRVKHKHNTSPKEAVKDGKSAIRWIRSHAKELGIDPLMIAAGGGSAGGHIAAATATLKSFNEQGEDVTISSRPNSLVLFNPVFDNGPDGFGHNHVQEYWEEFSPMHNLSMDTPPTIVFLGTMDKHIPVTTAKKYKIRMEEKGGRCDLFLYQDQPHGFFNEAKYYETLLETDRFLISLGYLKGQPTLQNKLMD